MKVCNTVFAAGVCAMGALSAWAQVTDFNIESRAGVTADGQVVANVLSIDFAGQYTGSQLLLELDSGTIYNTPVVGGDIAASEGFFGSFPDLQFDTYVAQGGLYSSGDVGAYGTGGGAVNIDPTEITAVFDSATKISQAWNPSAGNLIFDRSDFVVAQITLSPDANGVFRYFTSAGGEFFLSPQYSLVNGQLWVPEPATAATLALGLVALSRRRDR